ncbi:transketolase family protein [Patescibacteria group bacterium]|nr:transketolase family protein [Patescibacteria group bacterium]
MDEKQFSVRDGFGRGLVQVAQRDKKVVVVSADLKTSVRLTAFAQAFPERFFEVGVAEQNMVGVAAGLALAGFTPFACSFACFSPALTFAQIRQSVIENGVGVVIVGSHGGVVTGPDGTSHQAIEDVGLMRSFPEMKIVVPADDEQAQQAVGQLVQAGGPAYLRLSRPKMPRLGGAGFKLGRSRMLRKGDEVTLVGCGPVLVEVVGAADLLADKGVGVEIIDCSTVNPLDEKTILDSGRKTKRVVVVEDHQPATGLASAVSLLFSRHQPMPLLSLGVEKAVGSGSDWQSLLAKNGLDSNNIVKKVISFVNKYE